ncbi:hypothetical protein DW904_04140 [Ruminococcus sp. AM42-11]|nr:hypothetical protein DW904_04140 [Ruminococcus sp. AM42-11]
MKNHSRNLHAPLCGRFHPNSVAVARYGALIRAKSPTNCDAHLAESLFQTRSKSEKRKISFGDRSGCEQGEACYRSRSKQETMLGYYLAKTKLWVDK